MCYCFCILLRVLLYPTGMYSSNTSMNEATCMGSSSRDDVPTNSSYLLLLTRVWIHSELPVHDKIVNGRQTVTRGTRLLFIDSQFHFISSPQWLRCRGSNQKKCCRKKMAVFPETVPPSAPHPPHNTKQILSEDRLRFCGPPVVPLHLAESSAPRRLNGVCVWGGGGVCSEPER